MKKENGKNKLGEDIDFFIANSGKKYIYDIEIIFNDGEKFDNINNIKSFTMDGENWVIKTEKSNGQEITTYKKTTDIQTIKVIKSEKINENVKIEIIDYSNKEN